ncbi:MAG: DUF61 family protein [Candidatus Heimdallarchaeota archaeon]|nr:DUF61 family protein [Candidatus Heimdallarchaeota archaeon]
MSDKFSKYMKNQIDTINLHLPRKTLNLKQVLMLKEPSVKLRDGNVQRFEEEELEYVKSKIDQSSWHQILLPIIITRRRDFGDNAYTVGGDIGNLYLIMSLFEELPPFSVWKFNLPKDKVFYKPQIQKIRKELKSLTVLAFT